MKIAHVISLMVASFAAASFATALNFGVHDKVVAALAARDLSLDEINNIINLMPRQEQVTVTVTPVDCPPYGPPSTLTPTVPLTSSTTVTVTSSSTSFITTIFPPAPSTPTSEASSETPGVPTTSTTPTVETTPVPPITTVESSVPLTPVPNTPTLSSESSTVVETTSSSTMTTTSVSTTSTSETQTTATASTSTGIPQAPNSNGAGTACFNLGVAGLMAVLALA